MKSKKLRTIGMILGLVGFLSIGYIHSWSLAGLLFLVLVANNLEQSNK